MSKVVFGTLVLFSLLVSLMFSWHSWKCALQHGRGKCFFFQFLSAPVLSPLQEQLIDVFKSVGHVVGFRCDAHSVLFFQSQLRSRLVFDRETGKPRGYGFCEFAGTSNPSFIFPT